ncbi:hypothetical protein [Aquirhabdus sp.]|uniref:hypothetical protein n=1 Tax=Aquirhabdus sp. TaxID=2824160 RepID=UPI00396C6ABC
MQTRLIKASSIQPPYFANTVRDYIPIAFEGLYQRTRTEVTDADKKLGLELLIEANCDLIDSGLVTLLDELASMNPSLKFEDTQVKVEDVKAKARHYIQWVGNFISNDRLPPIIAHYHTMMHQLELSGDSKPYLAFNITPEFAVDLQRVLGSLADGSNDNLDEVIEMLVRALEETMKPLFITPKDLMKFNYVVDKTLNGVIALVISIYKRMLRKTIPKIPRELYPRIAAHLNTFVVV